MSDSNTANDRVSAAEPESPPHTPSHARRRSNSIHLPSMVDLPHHHTAEDTSEREAGEGERWFSQGLWQKPRILHDWGDDNERNVSWSELFMDLIFVSAVARLGEAFRGEEGPALATWNYILCFQIMFQMWTSCTQYSTRFNTDDLSNKVFYYAFMLGIMGMGMHITNTPDGGNGVPFSVCACFVRLLLSLMSFRVAYHLPRARQTTVFMGTFEVPSGPLIPTVTQLSCLCFLFRPRCLPSSFHSTQGLNALVWLGAVFASSHNRVYWFWGSIAVDVTRFPILILRYNLIKFGYLEAAPGIPLHIDHFTERFGLFIVLVMGEAITGVTQDPVHANPLQSRRLYVATTLGFLVVAALKLLYFDVDMKEIDNHALRISVYKGMGWSIFHNVLACSLAALGSGVDIICVAMLGEGDLLGDSRDLGPRVDRGRKITAYSLAISMACLTTIRLMHAIEEETLETPILHRIYWLQVVAQYVCVAVFAASPTYTPNTRTGIFGMLGIMAVACVFLVALNLVDEVVSRRLAREDFAKGVEVRAQRNPTRSSIVIAGVEGVNDVAAVTDKPTTDGVDRSVTTPLVQPNSGSLQDYGALSAEPAPPLRV